ncbi:hypothetical protein GCM10022254_19070 [Actinomadura meridiana]|uniref:Uncharacterized protein n=1 Tax=Actinomadura meridiana TaxID=559626 RepID=A0ABP8BWH0_9ACTN
MERTATAAAGSGWSRVLVGAAVQRGLQGAGRFFFGVVGRSVGPGFVHGFAPSRCADDRGGRRSAVVRTGRREIGLTARQNLRSGGRPAEVSGPAAAAKDYYEAPHDYLRDYPRRDKRVRPVAENLTI